MEKPPYFFQDITHFSVVDVEKRNPKIDYISRLNLEIKSSIPHGRHSLSLVKPLHPLDREGEKLNVLKTLCHDEIESILAFRGSNGEKNARIEIIRKAPGTTISVRCKQIEGVPGWDEKE